MLSTFKIQLWHRERGFILLGNKMEPTQKLKNVPMIFYIVCCHIFWLLLDSDWTGLKDSTEEQHLQGSISSIILAVATLS